MFKKSDKNIQGNLFNEDDKLEIEHLLKEEPLKTVYHSTKE